MSETPQSLYGHQPEAPKAEPVGLLDQLAGVFTSPVELFQRLRKAPSWGWALGLLVVMAVVITLVWGLKVDVDEMIRPILERNPQIPASQVDMIIEMQKKFILPFGLIFAVVGTPAVLALVGFIYWLLGRGLAEEGAPSYLQSFSAAVVPSLVKVPQMILILVICLVRPIGGLTPDKIAPTSLGYFLHPEGLKLQAFLYTLDLFTFAEAFLTYLALRHLARLKTTGALIGALLPLLLAIGFRVMQAK